MACDLSHYTVGNRPREWFLSSVGTRYEDHCVSPGVQGLPRRPESTARDFGVRTAGTTHAHGLYGTQCLVAALSERTPDRRVTGQAGGGRYPRGECGQPDGPVGGGNYYGDRCLGEA